jgi:ribose 5-phosphate isomerase A
VVIDEKELKVEAARAALGEVRSGMALGLGTGSTAEEFVRLLAEAVGKGDLQRIRVTCTSKKTEELAKMLGLEVMSFSDLHELDLTGDGADEIDRDLHLIKGGGGALLREKIVEQASQRFIVIADESKLVDSLGHVRLPVAVVSFATSRLMHLFLCLGLDPILREKAPGTPFVTDDGHHIIDIAVPEHDDVSTIVDQVTRYAGVVDTGFFATEASEAIIATSSGLRRLERVFPAEFDLLAEETGEAMNG